MSKRRRTTGGFRITTRPIDKKVIVVNLNGISATQQNVTLFTATFPCTITGVRWSLSVGADAGTVFGRHVWVIQKIGEGFATPDLSTTSGADLMIPEQNIIAYGSGFSQNDTDSGIHYAGSTKSMRKLQEGDTLLFSIEGTATNTSGCMGAIQFFCRA